MRRLRTWGPGLLLVSPSIILVGIFVYGLIGVNVRTSLAETRDRITGRVTNPGGLANYTNLLTDAQPIDPLSGNARLNGIPVTISAV